VDAGALATALCVLSLDESDRLVRGVDGAEYLLVMTDGRRIESAGWRGLVATPPPSGLPSPVAALQAAGQDAWDPAFALTVSINIGLPPGNRKRPYVAVWIEDGGRKAVRTLEVSHLRKDDQWLPKLPRWMDKNRERLGAGGPELLASMTSATRGPGIYTLTWDGKDDAGQLVPAGRYMVLIEGMREGGQYVLLHQALDVPGEAGKYELQGNPEIPSATIDYHRVRAQ